MDRQCDLFVGIDWGSTEHAVCLLAAGGQILAERRFEHGGRGLWQLLEWLQPHVGADWARLGVAIEIPHGALVEVLEERGAAVHAINPRQLDRFRDRFSVAGAKDDRRDARVLADSLRTDPHAFRRLLAPAPEQVRLRELSRAYQLSKRQLRAATNRLWDLLQRSFPSLLALCPGADEPWLWELLERASSPQAAAALKPAWLEKLLRRHRLHRFDAQALAAALAQAPLPLREGTAQAIAERIASQLGPLKMLQAQRRELKRKLKQLLEQMEAPASAPPPAAPAGDAEPAQGAAPPPPAQPPRPTDAAIVDSLKGFGVETTAVFLAEAAQGIAQRDLAGLRGQCGTAPVTRQSGKSRQVVMRRGCNRRLRLALHQAAQTAVGEVERWKRLYDRLRQRGATHARALRQVGDRMLKVMVHLLRKGELFDLTKLAAGYLPAAEKTT